MAEFCLSKSFKNSNEFTSFAKKRNISNYELEILIHMYGNQIEDNNLNIDFNNKEMVDYIDNLLQINKSVEVSNDIYDKVLKLYNNYFINGRRIYNTEAEAKEDYNLYKNILGENNAFVSETSNGKWQLSIAKPVNSKIDNSQIEKEMQAIKEKAIADGTFMKAPNGNPTNLNEKQWLQVRTKAFKEWFGDWENDSENASKIVDENGEPLVVYHGSSKNINIFEANYKPVDGGFYGLGSYFTNNKDYAENYGNKIHEVFLNIKNPKEISAKDESMLEKEITENDGVIADFFQVSDDVDWKEFVVPKSNQVKSATGNNGEFNTSDNNIYNENHFTSYQDTRDDELYKLTDQINERDLDVKEYINFIKRNSRYNAIIEAIIKGNTKRKGSLLKGLKIKLENPVYAFSGSVAVRNKYNNNRAFYDNSTKTIYIDTSANYNKGDSTDVLMHELMHAITINAVLNNPEYKAKFETILNDYQKVYNNHRYSTLNSHRLEEFIANIWTDPDTINGLKSIESERLKSIESEELKKEETNISSLWEEIKKIIKSLFEGAVKNSLFEEATIELYNLLEQPVEKVKQSDIENTDSIYFENHYKNGNITISSLNEQDSLNKQQKTALNFINTIKEKFNSIIDYDDKNHKYTIYETPEDKKRNKNGKEAENVTTHINKGKIVSFDEHFRPSAILGNTADRITRDFFSGKIDKNYEYHNLTSKQFNDLISQLETLKEFLNIKYGLLDEEKNIINKPIILTDEFPICALNNKGKYLAGTTDMLIIDGEGTIHVLDMKCKKRQMREGDVKKYNQQVTLYQHILQSTATATTNEQIKFGENALIQFRANYDHDLDNNIEEGDKYKQIKLGDKNIQYTDGYTGIKLLYANNKEKIEDGNTVLELNESESKLEENELKGIKSIFGKEILASKEALKLVPSKQKKLSNLELIPDKQSEQKQKQKSNIISSIEYQENHKKIQVNNLHNSPLLTALERKFLANYIMKQVSVLITHIQVNPERAKKIFKGLSNVDITKLERSEIIKHVGIENIFNLIKDSYFSPNSPYIKNMDDLHKRKIKFAFNNFEALIDEGYAKLVELEGIAVSIKNNHVDTNEDIKISLGDESLNDYLDSDKVAEKEKESWQTEIRHMSVKSSLSKQIRVTLETMLTNKTDKFGFGFADFIDSTTAVNQILFWVQNCTTIEEMETELEKHAEYYPYLNILLSAIKPIANSQNPLRQKFFQNFKKDFSKYCIVTAEKQQDGTIKYNTKIINSKGAADALMSATQMEYLIDSRHSNLFKEVNKVTGKGKIVIDAVNNCITKLIKLQTQLNNDEIDDIDKFLNDVIHSIFHKIKIPIDDIMILRKMYDTKNHKALKDALTQAEYILNGLKYNHNEVLCDADNKLYNPVAYYENDIYSGDKEIKDKLKDVKSDYKKLFELLGYYMDENYEACTFENGKMHYSFVSPSYMSKLIINLKDAINEDPNYGKSGKFEAFIQKQYKNYRWFYDNNTKIYYNNWLELIDKDANMRGILDHKIQLNYNKIPYNELSELDYTLAMMQEFFIAQKTKDKNVAWYRVPILANKPSAEYVRFKRYHKNYKKELLNVFAKNAIQEILRIKTVLERAVIDDGTIQKIGVKDKLTYDIPDELLNDELKERIKKDETNKSHLTCEDLLRFKGTGAEFKFLDYLNKEFENGGTDLGKMILAKINSDFTIKDSDFNKNSKEIDFINALRKTIENNMNSIVESEIDNWKKLGLFETVGENESKKYKYFDSIAPKTKNDTYEDYENKVRAELENYVWNDMSATINIIQLTATDLAYYKNMEDFQKRYAQVHAPSLKFDITAIWNGERVTDGYERTTYLKDNIVSSDLSHIVEKIFNDRIKTIKNENEKDMWNVLKDNIVEQFKKINVADAQGYSCPTSYRKKMIQAGKWDNVMEEAFKRIQQGNFNLNDLNVILQPFKPFVYSQISKASGVSTMSTIKVGIQNKNSEYLLILADALIRGANENHKLTAIFDFMESTHYSEYDFKKHCPAEGATYRTDGIDTIQFQSAVNAGSMGAIDINDENLTVEQMIGILKENTKSTLTKDSKRNWNDQFVHTIPYEDYGFQQEVPAHFLKHSQMMGSQFRILSLSDIQNGTKFIINNNEYTYDNKHDQNKKSNLMYHYQDLIYQNILDSYDELIEYLNLKSKSQRDRDAAISKLLIEEIKKDSKYGPDVLYACSINPNTDTFNIPLCDPIQSIRIQELMNSIIKSRINKQKIPGGPVVQASSFGMSENLRILFTDKAGKEIKRNPGESDDAYKERLKKLNAQFKGMEVYLPIQNEDLKKKLTKEDGSLMSIEEACTNKIISQDMLRAIGYRIPTEDKYSMIPMIIKGFVPATAGEVCIMPKEITLLTGSDFDIDKMYIMMKSWNTNTESDGSITNFTEVNPIINSDQSKNPKMRAINRAARNNEIFDIQWAVLTHEDTWVKMFNPGSFDEQKKTARIVTILNGKDGSNYTYDELQKMSLKKLEQLAEDATKRNIVNSTTQVYFHKQNMTAGKLIGIFANHNVSHAFCNMHEIHFNNIKIDFSLNGYKVSSREEEGNINQLDLTNSLNGMRISKTIAGFLSASVDAVKDPVLSFLNLNKITASPAMVLARLGFDTDTIGMFMSQPIIKEICTTYNIKNNEKPISIEKVILDKYKSLAKDDDIKNVEEIENITKEQLALGLNGKAKNTLQLNVLCIFKQLVQMSKDLEDLTFLTKFNSMSNAVGPTIANTMVMEARYNKFLQKMKDEDNAPFTKGAKNIIENTPILRAFYECAIGSKDKPGNPHDREGLATLMFKNHFPHYSETIKSLFNDLIIPNINKTLDSKTINSIVCDFIYYKLTCPKEDGSIFFNCNDEVRYNFIHNFPTKCIEQLNKLTNIELRNIIKLMPSNKKCPVATLNTETGKFSVDVIEQLKDSWSDLMNDEKTFTLGRDLFLYNLMRSGFIFSPKTMLHLASCDVKLAMGNYIELIKEIALGSTATDLKNFWIQYKRNHANNSKIVPVYEGDNKVTNNKLKINVNNDYIENIRIDDKNCVDMIVFNNELYYANNTSLENTDEIIYEKIETLGNNNNFIEYNGQEENALDMKSQMSLQLPSVVTYGKSDDNNEYQNIFESMYEDIPNTQRELSADEVISICKELNITVTNEERYTASEIIDAVRKFLEEADKETLNEFNKTLEKFCK